ncbi:NUDIX hydrolase [Patescibacteria group bacterium]|nr:NUDIX hydrolase [Patescibacteria group bacterium]
MVENTPAVVFVIIENVFGHQGKILLLQEKNRPEPRMWKLPGGTLDKGEWPEVTAYREALEETGLLIKTLYDEDKIFDEKREGRFGPYRFIVFRADYMRGTTLVGDKVERIGFFSKEEVKGLIEKREIVPTHVPTLKKYLELKSPAK